MQNEKDKFSDFKSDLAKLDPASCKKSFITDVGYIADIKGKNSKIIKYTDCQIEISHIINEYINSNN